MDCIWKYSIFVAMLLVSGCSDKKSDLATNNGKYFIESLGNNVNQKNLEESVVPGIGDGNFDYRYDSLNAKLSGSGNLDIIRGHSKDYYNILAVPTIYSDSTTTLSSNGKLMRSRLLSNGSVSKIWEKTINREFCNDLSLGIKDGFLIATCGSNMIRGLDFENGDELWKLEVDNPIASRPLFVGDVVVLFAKNDAVYGVNYKSGEVQWYVPNVINTNNRSLFSVVPLLVDGYVIQQTYDDQLRAIDPADGQIKSTVSVSNRYTNIKGKEFLNHYGNIAYDETEKSMYLNNSSGSIVKVKIDSDKPDWIVPAVVSKPVWSLGNIIVAVDDLGSVVAFSKFDGKKIWSNNILKKIIQKEDEKDLFGKPKPYNEVSLTPPVVVDGKIIVISSNKKLVIISPENGRILDVKNYTQNIYGLPFVNDNKLYVMTDNGRMVIQL